MSVDVFLIGKNKNNYSTLKLIYYFKIKLNINYVLTSYKNFIITDWERPKPNSSTGPPMTRKSSSASSPRDSGTPRNQNNREMTTVSVYSRIYQHLILLN